MKTCKDCLHYEVCKAIYVDLANDIFNPTDCTYFTNRSEWVQLPCKAVYSIFCGNTKFVTAVMSKSIEDLSIHEIRGIDKDGYYYSSKEAADNVMNDKNETCKGLFTL